MSESASRAASMFFAWKSIAALRLNASTSAVSPSTAVLPTERTCEVGGRGGPGETRGGGRAGGPHLDAVRVGADRQLGVLAHARLDDLRDVLLRRQVAAGGSPGGERGTLAHERRTCASGYALVQ